MKYVNPYIVVDSIPGCPFLLLQPCLAVMSWLSCPDCSVLAVLSWLFCAGGPVLAAMFCLSSSFCPVLSCLSYPGCPVTWLYCPDFPVVSALSLMSCPCRLVLFLVSCSCSHVLPVLFLLFCLAVLVSTHSRKQIPIFPSRFQMVYNKYFTSRWTPNFTAMHCNIYRYISFKC